MYTLYVKPGCPFCVKVLQVVEEQNIPVEIKETIEEGVVDELITHGGKRQVPYLIDGVTGVAMYESDDIIAYLMSKLSDVTGNDGEGVTESGEEF